MYNQCLRKIHKLLGVIFSPVSAIFFKLPDEKYRPSVSSCVLLAVLVIKGPRFSSTSPYDIWTRIGGRTYNNGRTCFIDAAVHYPVVRSSIRANKVGRVFLGRISARTKLHSVSFRLKRGFKIFLRACAWNAIRREKTASLDGIKVVCN